jgi:hypothetical protein
MEEAIKNAKRFFLRLEADKRALIENAMRFIYIQNSLGKMKKSGRN